MIDKTTKLEGISYKSYRIRQDAKSKRFCDVVVITF